MVTLLRVCSALVLLVFLGWDTSVAAEPGITATTIKIGNTNPYSGPASSLGTIGKAIGAYFRKINEEGGINGRKVDFITYDDSSTPAKTVEAVRKLVEQDQVALVFQSFGTANNSAIRPYLNQQKVPHLFVGSGATTFNAPKDFPWTTGWQPNYQTDGLLVAQYILKNVQNPKIGILYQNDDYGREYVKGLKDGLGEAARKVIVSEQPYEAKDRTLDSQIANLRNSGANVFYNVSTPQFSVQATKKAEDIGWKPLHLLDNVASFYFYSTVLKQASVEASKNIVAGFYFKNPTDLQWNNDAAMKDWVSFMRKYYPEGNLQDPWNVYAVLVSQTLVHVLKQAGNDLSRANIMKQATSIKDLALPLLLPGIKINTSRDDYRPIKQEQFARFDGERWIPIGAVLSASECKCACKDGSCLTSCCPRSDQFQ